MVVDFMGVSDTTGKQLASTTKYNVTTIETTDYEAKFNAAEITGLRVKVTDPAGAVLFAGDWGTPLSQ